MNILLARPKIDRGGAEQIIIWLAQGLLERGYHVVIVSSGGDWVSRIPKSTTYYQIPLFPSNIKNLFRASISMRRIIKAERINVINTHHRFATLVGKIATQHTHIPVVSTVHELRKNIPLLVNLTIGDYVIVFSQATKNHLIRNGIKDAEKIQKIPVGFPNVTSHSRIENPRRNEFKPEEKSIVACIARLSPEKGCSYFIKAAGLLLSDGRNVQFLIVGDGPDEESLITLSEELGIKDHITFLGWKDEISEFIANVDFLVLPSLSEALGLTILEGWHLGKPTIACNVGGISELIQDGENGLLVPSMDEKALAKAIDYLLLNPGETIRMGKNGNKRLSQIASFDMMVDETIRVFSYAIGGQK